MPTEAFYSRDTGEFVACFAARQVDGQRRFYRLSDMRAPGGITEIIAALEGLPKRADDEILAHETY